jgi:acyl-CoA synthetase (NDP forming)
MIRWLGLLGGSSRGRGGSIAGSFRIYDGGMRCAGMRRVGGICPKGLLWFFHILLALSI